MNLPWKKGPSEDDLIAEAKARLLMAMRKATVGTTEYQTLLEEYEKLSQIANERDKIALQRWCKRSDGIVTSGILGVTLTAEQWTPLTSRWYNSLMRPRNGDLKF
jgi:hypothetical protein